MNGLFATLVGLARYSGVCLNPMIVITVYKYNQGLFRYTGPVQLEDGLYSGVALNETGMEETSRPPL